MFLDTVIVETLDSDGLVTTVMLTHCLPGGSVIISDLHRDDVTDEQSDGSWEVAGARIHNPQDINVQVLRSRPIHYKYVQSTGRTDFEIVHLHLNARIGMYYLLVSEGQALTRLSVTDRGTPKKKRKTISHDVFRDSGNKLTVVQIPIDRAEIDPRACISIRGSVAPEGSPAATSSGLGIADAPHYFVPIDLELVTRQSDDSSFLANPLAKAIEIKPSIFGITIDLKKVWEAFEWHRGRKP